MRQLPDLEHTLGLLVAEHAKLLGHLDTQQAAMKAFDMRAMDAAAKLQEASRLRIASYETRRRSLVSQIARLSKLPESDLTVSRLAELYPQRGPQLVKLRDDLRALIHQISLRTTVSGKLAAAVAGHLNTVVRLLAGAVEQAGTYTKNGIPRVSARIGVMEAVG